VKAELKQEKVTVLGGKEVKGPADKTAPGDVIEYTVVYKNTDKSPAGNVVAHLPIPANMVFVAGSAVPAGAMASLDSINFAPIPLKHKVKNAQGQMVEQDVPLSEYRALRWSLGDLAAGESRTVSARVKVRQQ
jgi:uncharacterized repeat protein (TIGR01451 family)